MASNEAFSLLILLSISYIIFTIRLTYSIIIKPNGLSLSNT